MIRLAEEKDTREIWESHVSSIRNICSRNYRPDQIERWSAFQYNHEHWVKTMKQDRVFVVEDNGCVRGFCHVAFRESDNAEVVGLYLSPAIAGKGFGRQLVEAALDYLKNKKQKKIVLDSTKTSIGFYERMGFLKSGPELLREMRGTQIECQPMEITFI